MEYILDAIFEFTFKVCTTKKYSRWVRYPILFLAGAIYVGVILFFVFCGFLILEDGLGRAIFMWVLALASAIGIVWIIRDRYKAYKKKISKLK